MKAGIYKVVLFVSAYALLVRGQPALKMWEEVCLRTHNMLRAPHQLSDLSWSPLLHAFADLKAMNLVLEDNNITFGAADLRDDLLEEDLISFNYELRSIKYLSSSAELESTIYTEDIIKSWYSNVLFSTPNADKEKYDHLMDPFITSMGCTLHSVKLDSGLQRIYLTVAYQQNKTMVAKSKEEGIISRSLDSKARTCGVNCTSIGSCYSHKASGGFVGSRVGTGRFESRLSREYCKCQKDPVYSFQVPYCEGPCFVHCPLATQENRKQCNGARKCTCMYGDGGAFCE